MLKEYTRAQRTISRGQTMTESSEDLKIFRGKPFWVWNKIEHEKQKEELKFKMTGITPVIDK